MTIVDAASGRRIDLDAGDYDLGLLRGEGWPAALDSPLRAARGGREVVRVTMERSPTVPPVKETAPPRPSSPPLPIRAGRSGSIRDRPRRSTAEARSSSNDTRSTAPWQTSTRRSASIRGLPQRTKTGPTPAVDQRPSRGDRRQRFRAAARPRPDDGSRRPGAARHLAGGVGPGPRRPGRVHSPRPARTLVLITIAPCAARTWATSTGRWPTSTGPSSSNPETSRFYGQRGLVHALRHDLGRALADAERALRSEPRNREFLRLRGWVRAQRGDHAGALADYALAFEGRPLDATQLADRASVEALAGHRGDAEADFEAALRLDPSSAWILRPARPVPPRRQRRSPAGGRRLRRGATAQPGARRSVPESGPRVAGPARFPRRHRRLRPGAGPAPETARSPFSADSPPATPSCTAPGPRPIDGWATSTVPWPTSTRRSGSTRTTPRPGFAAGACMPPRATSPGPSPTSTGPSPSVAATPTSTGPRRSPRCRRRRGRRPL